MFYSFHFLASRFDLRMITETKTCCLFFANVMGFFCLNLIFFFTIVQHLLLIKYQNHDLLLLFFFLFVNGFLLTYVIIKTNLYSCNLVLQPNPIHCLFVCVCIANCYAFDICINITWGHQWWILLTYNNTKCEQIKRAQLKMRQHRLRKFHHYPLHTYTWSM